ncbi:MAG: anhydro-N-acetylmuramic acid kinase [Bacteroidales bacterium]|nr:anhydro-N-acetylmuramic acid kinase [Bacteroidales bacterium]
MKATFCNGIGIMSGTSLDGIDLAWCDFNKTDSGWAHTVRKATTIPYEPSFKEQLKHATELSAYEYARLDVALGELIAEKIKQWIGQDIKPEFIASHGHTVFHQPHLGLTTQIGSGAVIASRTGITTVCDFRTSDVALHGQGAPLVPIGDELLFGQYGACLNLGGFSNISFKRGDQRIAFDISPCNMALNHLSTKMGLAYDKDGEIARSGKIIGTLFDQLNQIKYYHTEPPKSLGKEWFEAEMLPLLEQTVLVHSIPDCIRTVVEHIAFQIAKCLPPNTHNLLITGGGAHHQFLIEQIQKQTSIPIIVPDDLTIDYKEAIVFAFLGMLRLNNLENCLQSVTGAIRNCCGGAVYNG